MASDDVGSVHAAVAGMTMLGEAVPKPQEVCKKLEPKLGGALADIFQAAAAGQVLKCQFKASPEITKVSESVGFLSLKSRINYS